MRVQSMPSDQPQRSVATIGLNQRPTSDSKEPRCSGQRGSFSHRLGYPASSRTRMRGSARDLFHRCVWRPLNLIHAFYHMAFHGLGPRSPQGDTAIRWSIFHLETSLQNTSRLRRSLSVTRHLCRVYRFGFAEPGTSASSRPVRRKAVRFKRSPSPATQKSSSRLHPKSTPSMGQTSARPNTILTCPAA